MAESHSSSNAVFEHGDFSIDGDPEHCDACRRAAQIVAIDSAAYEEFVVILDLHKVPRSANIRELTKIINGRGN